MARQISAAQGHPAAPDETLLADKMRSKVDMPRLNTIITSPKLGFPFRKKTKNRV